MVVTKKDKKLIIFILSTLIALWFAYIIASAIYTRINFSSSNIKSLTSNNLTWLNSSRSVNKGDLKGRVILLDFWTYACVNCLHVVPEVKKLENEFGDRLTVIGVHSGKFSNEKDNDSIKKAIIKNNIDHLVVNDPDFKVWNSFKVKSWPTLMLLDPSGNIVKKYEGEILAAKVRHDVKKTIEKFKYQLSSSELPIALEKNKSSDYVLKFPAKIKLVQDFSYKSIGRTNALFIANTGKNKITITNLNGNTLLEIGSGDIGFDDGNFTTATFNAPRGLLFKDNALYVADTGNHALRKINFINGTVSTIAGTGKRGEILTSEKSAKTTDLASPWDLALFPNADNIIIANAGTHQLLKHNISSATIRPFAGNGNEELTDGVYPNNSLAQPSGLSVSGGQLYFVDSETSSLRVAGSDGRIKTLIGKGLFDFGKKDGKKEDALMQHPEGLIATDKEIYIADTHNHLIRKYIIKTGELSTYSGNERGDGLGGRKSLNYDEPEAITFFSDRFYISDSNNNRIIELTKNSGNSKILDVIPQQKLPADNLLEYLPNLEKLPTKKVKSTGNVIINFNLKQGWVVNKSAPSFFNLVEVKNKKEANLIASFNDSMIRSGSIKLPDISIKNTYYLQGTVYYCEDKENALCLVKSFEQKLIPSVVGEGKIKINFTYK